MWDCRAFANDREDAWRRPCRQTIGRLVHVPPTSDSLVVGYVSIWMKGRIPAADFPQYKHPSGCPREEIKHLLRVIRSIDELIEEINKSIET